MEELHASPVSIKYHNFQVHLISHILPRIDAWCLEFRVTNRLPTSNNNTNNLVECSFRYTKETQLNRHKAYNLCDLLSLLLDNSEFYQNKCVDCANNVLESWLRNCHSKYVVTKQPDIDLAMIQQVGPASYLVPSETQPDVSYLVDMDIRHCTCPAGGLRGPCKHKYVVSVNKNIASFDALPTTNPAMRKCFVKLGTGKDLPLDYFLPMQAPVSSEPDNIIVPTMSELSVQASVTTQPSQPGNMSVQSSTTTEVDTAEIRQQLCAALQTLQGKIAARIEEDPVGYKKAVADLQKTVEKLPSTRDSALQKCLHSFGKSVTQVQLQNWSNYNIITWRGRVSLRIKIVHLVGIQERVKYNNHCNNPNSTYFFVVEFDRKNKLRLKLCQV